MSALKRLRIFILIIIRKSILIIIQKYYRPSTELNWFASNIYLYSNLEKLYIYLKICYLNQNNETITKYCSQRSVILKLNNNFFLRSFKQSKNNSFAKTFNCLISKFKYLFTDCKQTKRALSISSLTTKATKNSKTISDLPFQEQ